MGETRGGGHQIRVFDLGQIRQPVEATAERLDQPFVPELVELVTTIAASQRLAQAESEPDKSSPLIYIW
tara:strand:- start:213 stop:419 length:207 start_codon:yes stop_codon:yes gene_type:complete